MRDFIRIPSHSGVQQKFLISTHTELCTTTTTAVIITNAVGHEPVSSSIRSGAARLFPVLAVLSTHEFDA